MAEGVVSGAAGNWDGNLLDPDFYFQKTLLDKYPQQKEK
jgi:hypothetical protein